MDLATALDAWSAAFAAHGFAGATLARVAAGAGLPVDRLATLLAGRWEALDQLNLAIDRAALARARPDASQSMRDRLFELAMARFEAMRAHRPALARLVAEARMRPGLALSLALQLGRSANTLLGAADAPTTGLAGIARIKALAAILADVGRVWERDDDPDLGATMAALDRRLAQAERCATWMCPRSRASGAVAPDAPDGGDGPADLPAEGPADLPAGDATAAPADTRDDAGSGSLPARDAPSASEAPAGPATPGSQGSGDGPSEGEPGAPR